VNRFFLSALVIVLCLGATGMLSMGNPAHSPQDASRLANLATNAAFRDGLYQGKLAAQRGDAPHVAIGRWASEADRATFSDGYQLGYRETR
jgi:hypothetical protein